MAALRAATPPDLQPVITDMFESIILFDNKAVSATSTAMSGNKYKVELTVEAHKKKADGLGSETEAPMNDLIDIGIFSAENHGRKPLYLAKQKITGNSAKYEFVVDGKPFKAGIDPYNKLIDRKPDDNLVEVTKR